MDNHCAICGAYLADTGRMICEKCEILQQTNVKPCPGCGEVPHIGYACGEYFIMGATKDCPVCDGFLETHSSEQMEIKVWNRRAQRIGNTNAGHKAPKGCRAFCTYTVYDNRTDFPIIVGGTSEESAKAMKITLPSFYCAVNRARTGKIKRWAIIKQYEDGKPDYDHPERKDQ